MLLIVHLLELGWWYVANRSEEPLVVEPGHPVESGELDIVDSLPGAVLSNNLCFIQADRRLGLCVDAPISQECCSGRRVGRRAGSMVDHDALVDLAVQATLEASDEVALGQELCRKHGISEQTFYRWRSKYGGMQVSEAKKRSVELRATGRRAAPLSGLRGMAPLAVAGKWFLRMNKLRFVPIGRRTSDNEVDVHGNASLCCCIRCGFGPSVAPAVPIRGHRRWTGAPPLWDCLDRQCGVASCAQPMPRPRGVAPVPSIPEGWLLTPCRARVRPP